MVLLDTGTPGTSRDCTSWMRTQSFKMLESDMYMTVIGQAILELLSFKVGSENHQTGISLLQKFWEIFRNTRLLTPKMTSYLTSHNFQVLKIEVFYKPCKI